MFVVRGLEDRDPKTDIVLVCRLVSRQHERKDNVIGEEEYSKLLYTICTRIRTKGSNRTVLKCETDRAGTCSVSVAP